MSIKDRLKMNKEKAESRVHNSIVSGIVRDRIAKKYSKVN